MEQRVLEKIKKWEEYDALDPALREELNSIKDNENALMDAFYNDIAFGTGGLRGIIGVGTDRMNIYVVRKSTLGFLNYMINHYPNIKEMGVAISYDCRHNSYLFAQHAAMVIASRGVKAYLYTDIRSTPQLSFTVRNLKCAGGIMITASHNPPIYNGYKIYDHNGCQLIPELADEVISEIQKIDDMFRIETKDFDALVKEGLIELIDVEQDKQYVERVKEVVVNNVPKNNIKIVYTPLHGTGATHMVNLLTSCGYNVYPVEEQMVPDGNFTTLKSPNPEESSAFEYAINLGNKLNADILIATDPDADRMGIAAKDNQGNYVLLTGNQTGAILLDYLGKFKKPAKQGVVFNTIVTSNFAKAICDKYNLKLVQTLTGFKFIGEQAEKLESSETEEFFFGYEESYGYVIKDFVRDKDSFQATLLLAEVASYYKEQGKTLINVLYDLYDEFGYYQEGVHNISLLGIEGQRRIEKIMRHFQVANLEYVAGKHIQIFEDYDKLERIVDGEKSKLLLPQSFVLKYIFDDGGWFVLRPSGTEPKLKIYIAIKEDSYQKAQELISRLKQEVLDIIENIK